MKQRLIGSTCGMKNRKKGALVVIAICVLLGTIYFSLTFVALRRHDTRIHRMSTFAELGKKLAARLRTAPETPKTLGDMKTARLVITI